MDDHKGIGLKSIKGDVNDEYVNVLVVYHRAPEFRLDFIRAIADSDAELVSRLILSPISFKSVVKAINLSLSQYELAYGEILEVKTPMENMVVNNVPGDPRKLN